MNPRRALHGLKVAYYRQTPRVRHFLGGKRRVLLYVSSDTMLPHLLRYYDSVKALPGLHFDYFYPSMPANAEHNPTLERLLSLPIHRVDAIGARVWDLIVCADMPTPAGISKEMTPLLYVNHGLHIVSADGGENLYCYGALALDEHGAPLFSRMCEPNAAIAEAMRAHNPAMSRTMVFTGFKFADVIERAVEHRAETRRALGVRDDECLVGFFGTWREHSLFHALGAGLFDACAALRPKGYQFLFSIHPNEYRRYDPAIEPMGALVEQQRARGMLVRSPGEPFEAPLAACDVIVSDYSSMAESAVIAGRKLIFSPYPDGMVWKHSLTARLKQALPTLASVDALESTLDAVRAAPLDPMIAEARARLVCADHDEIARRVTLELIGEGATDA